MLFCQVQRSEADYGIFNFACTLERVAVVECSAYTNYHHNHWITKESPPLPSMTSLTRLFTPYVWLLIFLAILSFIVFILASARYLKMTGRNKDFEDYEDFWVPFR